MGRGFDWRWGAVIVGVIMLASGGAVPWFIRAAALLIGGGYLLWHGWQVWTGGRGSGGARVTYWRGQRIEVGPPRRGPTLPRFADIGPALLWLALGLVLGLAGATLAVAGLGY